jgi:hypothetical protein
MNLQILWEFMQFLRIGRSDYRPCRYTQKPCHRKHFSLDRGIIGCPPPLENVILQDLTPGTHSTTTNSANPVKLPPGTHKTGTSLGKPNPPHSPHPGCHSSPNAHLRSCDSHAATPDAKTTRCPQRIKCSPNGL